MSHAEILDDFLELTKTNIKVCLTFAADREHRWIETVYTSAKKDIPLPSKKINLHTITVSGID